MVLRDFYSSIYAWQFIRCIDEQTIDLCGAALCLTTAIDYVGASDDPAGGYDVYIAAASEGVACLAGKAATQALQDMVIADAFMVTKDAMAEKAKEINDIDFFIGANGGPVTPNQFLLARWWDAAMVPYHRLIMSTTHYKNLTDSLGTFKSADSCGRIKRAVDSIIRYDEIVDAVSDYVNKECFNEFLVALAAGGSKSTRNYAHAVARVIDDALECDCGENGHEEAAELAMGACLWYQLAPRYMARRQLLSYAAGTDVVREAYAWPAPGERLSAAADVCLRPGNTLHATTWEPLWKESRDSRSRPWPGSHGGSPRGVLPAMRGRKHDVTVRSTPDRCWRSVTRLTTRNTSVRCPKNGATCSRPFWPVCRWARIFLMNCPASCAPSSAGFGSTLSLEPAREMLQKGSTSSCSSMWIERSGGRISCLLPKAQPYDGPFSV